MKDQKDVRFVTEKIKGAKIATHIITDTTTGVQYLFMGYGDWGSGLTVLLDADGKPLIDESVLAKR